MPACERCQEKDGVKRANGQFICNDCVDIEDVLCKSCGTQIAGPSGYCPQCNGNYDTNEETIMPKTWRELKEWVKSEVESLSKILPEDVVNSDGIDVSGFCIIAGKVNALRSVLDKIEEMEKTVEVLNNEGKV
jgi:hypothetical protein